MMGFCISDSVARGRPSGRGWVRESIKPSPLAPARAPPSTENVACQTRSSSCGAAGYRRTPPASSRPAQASLSTAKLRAKTAPRSLPVTPKASKDSAVPPVPRPTSRRPFDSRSSTAASSATRSAFSSGSVTTPVPRRMRRVRAATCERKTKGEGRPPSLSWK